jgi:hypothetical protein
MEDELKAFWVNSRANGKSETDVSQIGCSTDRILLQIWLAGFSLKLKFVLKILHAP